MRAPIVLVTATEFGRAETTFARAQGLQCVVVRAEEDALCDAVEQHGARLLIVGSSPYRDRLYRTVPRGGVIARFGVGYDNVDLQKATAAGILCSNTPDVLQQSVAELTMALIGMASRQLAALAAEVRAGVWQPRQGVELEGKVLALVGSGAIARAVARIAAAGYGMRVVGYTRTPRAAPDAHFERVTSDFGEAVRAADFVSLHIPGSPENRHFLNAERLSLLSRSAWLVNTARGAVVDERALYDALNDRRLAGAALDVFDREPYVPEDQERDLRTLENVLLVPHIGSNTAEANRRMALRALSNVRLAHLGDFGSMDLLNAEVLERGPSS